MGKCRYVSERWYGKLIQRLTLILPLQALRNTKFVQFENKGRST